jgi:hypothetical protein
LTWACARLDADVSRPKADALEERDHRGQQLCLRFYALHPDNVQVPLPA